MSRTLTDASDRYNFRRLNRKRNHNLDEFRVDGKCQSKKIIFNSGVLTTVDQRNENTLTVERNSERFVQLPM